MIPSPRLWKVSWDFFAPDSLKMPRPLNRLSLLFNSNISEADSVIRVVKIAGGVFRAGFSIKGSFSGLGFRVLGFRV